MRTVRAALLVALTALWASTASAQAELGKVAGTLRDPSASFVSGATVSVKNERTGEMRRTTSSDKGYYLIPGLKPSSYTVRAEKDGLAPIEFTAMPVVAGQELTLDLEFKLAALLLRLRHAPSERLNFMTAQHEFQSISMRDDLSSSHRARRIEIRDHEDFH